MDLSTPKEFRSSADYSDDSCGAEQALIDGTPTLRSYPSRLKKSYQQYGAFIILQLLILAFYVGFFLSVKGNTICLRPRQSLVYSPAEEAIKYEKWRFNATLVIDSPYTGPPGEEVDEAWRKLLHNMNMALPGSDLRRLGTTSIPVPDRDDTYIAGMSVFHELHCLKRLRQYNYRDHYFPNITADEERLNRLHTDHCIDVLRQGIMCHADISLFTLQWSRDSLMPRADFSGEHECRNWDAINEWAGERRIDLSVPGLLVHPFRGASNAEGGITIDMSLLKNMALDPDSMEIAVGGGSLWADVYRFLDPRNLSATGTRNSLTGVVGSVLGGGISFFSQNHGWACDNVKQFEVVLANSSVVHASENENPDLFWALRGGGNNFGIVTSLTLEVFHQFPSYYTFQRWSMDMLESVFDRLEALTLQMPPEFEMVATTLGWHVQTNQFVITERLIASEKPALPRTLPVPSSMRLKEALDSHVLDERVYVDTTLAMSEKMDRMNAAGFFNYFGSVTVKNNVKVFMAIAETFRDEVSSIKDALGLQIYIVYNPLTVSTIQKMSRRGGNALGIRSGDGPLTIVNINLHWSDVGDTEKMRSFMRRLRHRIRHVAASMDMLHPYLFQNHAFEEDDIFAGYGQENRDRLLRVRDAVDPDGVFARLQPGYHKLR